MNSHLAIVVFAFLLVPSASFAREADKIPISNYTYGMKLDIARVVSMEEPDTRTCEVVKAKMTYVDTQGIVKAITYKKHAEICISSN
ncbi:topoisomerase II [Pseudomonas fluorescens]|uniref:Topoisomerase II n=1 Tax=Pseudomonas fluorescens TaxID=294 RepID=A0A379ID61_PSEFL|nr:hypothetical protein HZ99_05515 [Pseudomonas fluorescens]SUD30728.1 topoisomerase II [Pseudomonas fluorescens]